MSILIRQVHNRINRKNKNWLAIVCGETGSGKSYAAIKIATLIDPTFNIDRIVFTVKDFMDLVTSKETKKGHAIIFDEAGVQIASREWYSLRNKSINYVLQTFRHQNLAVIFTTPSFDFVDKQTRKLFHAYIETKSINRKKKYANVKWLNIQSNPKMDKSYYKYQRVRGSGIHKITNVRVHRPDKTMIKQYELKRRKYTKQLRDEILSGISKIEEKEKVVKLTREQVFSKIMESPDIYTKTYRNRKFIDQNLIIAKLDTSEREAKIVKAKVEAELKM